MWGPPPHLCPGGPGRIPHPRRPTQFVWCTPLYSSRDRCKSRNRGHGPDWGGGGLLRQPSPKILSHGGNKTTTSGAIWRRWRTFLSSITCTSVGSTSRSLALRISNSIILGVSPFLLARQYEKMQLWKKGKGYKLHIFLSILHE